MIFYYTLAIALISLGYTGLYVMKLNDKKSFLTGAEYNGVGFISFVACFAGAFLCLSMLFDQ